MVKRDRRRRLLDRKSVRRDVRELRRPADGADVGELVLPALDPRGGGKRRVCRARDVALFRLEREREGVELELRLAEDAGDHRDAEFGGRERLPQAEGDRG